MARYLVQSVSTAQTKRGKDYLRMVLVEPGGKTSNAVFWEAPSIKSGQVVDALTEVDSYQGQEQLNVKAMRVIADKPTNDEFLPRAAIDVSTMKAELDEFIKGVTDTGIRWLLSKLTDDPRWTRCPAGQKMHHAYLGGLIYHTVCLCRLASDVAARYPELRRDLLVFACVAHDVGKLEELEYDFNFDYSDEGRLLGHVQLGLAKLELLMHELPTEPGDLKLAYNDGVETLPSLSEKTRMLLRHIVLSHHGDFNSVQPQVIEAAVFHRLDMLDATMGAYLPAAEKARREGKTWTDKVGSARDGMFIE